MGGDTSGLLKDEVSLACAAVSASDHGMAPNPLLPTPEPCYCNIGRSLASAGPLLPC